MRPSEVRRKILSDHELIRVAVAEVESVAGRILAGEANLSSELREHAQYLYMKLCLHLDLEDTILVAALRDMSNFGQADDLAVEHSEQRELLTYLLERLADSTHPTELIVRDLLGFTSLLSEDMKTEEATMLSDELFGEDPEAVGGRGA